MNAQPDTETNDREFAESMLAYITAHLKHHAEDKGILKIGEICRDLGIRLSPAQMKMEREAFLKARVNENHQR